MLPSSPRLIVETDDGLEPVLDFINSAEKSLFIKQFTFTEPKLIGAVVERKKAGVDVRVMLNAKRSGGDRANDETFEQLRTAGIAVQWASSKFYVTHEKSVVVDEKAALVATFNLCEKYFTLTRDYGVITYNPLHVAQIIEVFNADWDHLDWSPGAYDGLLWSNANSRYHMAQFIDMAERRLDVQHPKFVDAVILERLAAAADRGVKIRVLCGGKHGISEWDILDTFASLRTLKRFGAKVHKQKNLRVHAKLIIVDNTKALVGSMNIDRSAFDLRRELGILTEDPELVGRLTQVFDSDWDSSHHYNAPDPLESAHHEEDDFPHDADLVHE
ncbi:phosphatidylserine/phosphatidylglycerophosphate/cardiolipin synthase family protein [Mycobacterium sp. E740]|uniref:phospholipase D-like domain-containing protein n=1 Tax=Mycobacterium sp. E740 TaxID=1834149 RepID=UPI0007FF9F8E|nr:phospholipase D-like domain-containing protein [Mycobacterium sp. E740]OBI82746.1 cardiolipin synthase [Mycobacterium sp. E740]